MEDEWTDPSQKRSIKFSVGLPQPAYTFVTGMSVLTNSPQSQVRQAKHTSLTHISFFATCTLYFAIIGGAPTNQYKDRKSIPKKQYEKQTEPF